MTITPFAEADEGGLSEELESEPLVPPSLEESEDPVGLEEPPTLEACVRRNCILAVQVVGPLEPRLIIG